MKNNPDAGGAAEIAGSLTTELRGWWAATVLAVAASEPQRRAFIAGYNGSPMPSPASDQMRKMHRQGATVRALLQAPKS